LQTSKTDTSTATERTVEIKSHDERLAGEEARKRPERRIHVSSSSAPREHERTRKCRRHGGRNVDAYIVKAVGAVQR
jgi:hypothetical protein